MQYNHYRKPFPYNVIDIYRICQIYEVNDPSGAKQHAIKKLLVAGKRGSKNEYNDMKEARDTIDRWLDIRVEEIQAK